MYTLLWIAKKVIAIIIQQSEISVEMNMKKRLYCYILIVKSVNTSKSKCIGEPDGVYAIITFYFVNAIIISKRVKWIFEMLNQRYTALRVISVCDLV